MLSYLWDGAYKIFLKTLLLTCAHDRHALQQLVLNVHSDTSANELVGTGFASRYQQF